MMYLRLEDTMNILKISEFLPIIIEKCHKKVIYKSLGPSHPIHPNLGHLSQIKSFFSEGFPLYHNNIFTVNIYHLIITLSLRPNLFISSWLQPTTKTLKQLTQLKQLTKTLRTYFLMAIV